MPAFAGMQLGHKTKAGCMGMVWETLQHVHSGVIGFPCPNVRC